MLQAAAKKSTPKTTTDFRSAKTGQFAKEGYAKKHPSTAVKETNRKKSP